MDGSRRFHIQRGLFLTALLSFLLFPAFSSLAQDGNAKKLSFRLSKLQFQIGKESDRLNVIAEERDKLQQQLKVVAEQRNKVQGEERALTKELAQIEIDLEKLDANVSDMEAVVAKRRALFERRLVAIYKTSQRASQVDFLAKADSVTQLMKRKHFLKRIAVRDREYIEELSVLILELEDERQRQRALRSAARKKVDRIEVLREELQQQEFKQAAVVKQARQKEQSQKAVVSKLKNKAAQLEKMIAELIEIKTREVAERETKPEIDEKGIEVVDIDRFEGRGLQPLKGKLPLPIAGDLLRTFGRHHHEEFSDIVFSKGLEFNADSDGKVEAVAKGRVILNQQLPGYGNVVIVDHGKRYYSLYGRLKNMLVNVGDIIDQGDTLAVVGKPDKRGRNFYFELRVRGKAINPTAYFKKRLVVKKASS